MSLGREIFNDIWETIQELEEFKNDTYRPDEDEFLSDGLAEGNVYKSLEDFEHIEQEGGGEGGTEWCHSVFKWKGKYYMMNYSYYSHNGCEFDGAIDGIQEVTPTEKTVTVYS